MDIADIVNIADIADWMLQILRWKQVSAYKVSWGCPVIVRVWRKKRGQLGLYKFIIINN